MTSIPEALVNGSKAFFFNASETIRNMDELIQGQYFIAGTAEILIDRLEAGTQYKITITIKFAEPASIVMRYSLSTVAIASALTS